MTARIAVECPDCGATFKREIKTGYEICPICNTGKLKGLDIQDVAMVLTYRGAVLFAAPIRLNFELGYPMWMAYNSARVACEMFAEEKFHLHPDGWYDEWGEWFHRRQNAFVRVGLARYEGGELCL